jgi:hypothetical protein
MAATLKPALWIVLASAASAAAASLAIGGESARELVAGLLGPLTAVVATWIVIDRAARRHPESVGRQMLGAFVVKALFFAGYVVLALQVLRLQPKPFVVSFTCYFIALYLIEALMFRRLFANMAQPPAHS